MTPIVIVLTDYVNNILKSYCCVESDYKPKVISGPKWAKKIISCYNKKSN